jgi:transposase-like protein
MKIVITCPHCGRQNAFGEGGEFDPSADGRFICEHCHQPFLVFENEPMTQEQFEARGQRRRSSD